MKKQLFLSVLSASLIFALNLVGQVNNSSRSKLFSISQGEKPVYSECSILINSSGSAASLVTKDDNDKYYLYDKGTRKGPFEDAKKIGWIVPEDQDEMSSSIFVAEGYANQEELLSYNNDGKMIIKSAGKTFGPYSMVLNLFTDHDQKMTAAITAEGMNAKLLTQGGTMVNLEAVPSYHCVSPSGKKVLIIVVKEYNPAFEFTNIDFSKMTTEQIMKLSQEIEQKEKNAPPPQAFIYFNDGKKLGPYPKNDLTGNNPAFCKTGGDNWFMTIEGKLYVNGALLANLGNEYVSNDDIWLSADGKRYAIITYDNIRFSDGASFKYPLVVKKIEKEGKTWLTWLSLENEKDIVLYSKPL